MAKGVWVLHVGTILEPLRHFGLLGPRHCGRHRSWPQVPGQHHGPPPLWDAMLLFPDCKSPLVSQSGLYSLFPYPSLPFTFPFSYLLLLVVPGVVCGAAGLAHIRGAGQVPGAIPVGAPATILCLGLACGLWRTRGEGDACLGRFEPVF